MNLQELSAEIRRATDELVWVDIHGDDRPTPATTDDEPGVEF